MQLSTADSVFSPHSQYKYPDSPLDLEGIALSNDSCMAAVFGHYRYSDKTVRVYDLSKPSTDEFTVSDANCLHLKIHQKIFLNVDGSLGVLCDSKNPTIQFYEDKNLFIDQWDFKNDRCVTLGGDASQIEHVLMFWDIMRLEPITIFDIDKRGHNFCFLLNETEAVTVQSRRGISPAKISLWDQRQPIPAINYTLVKEEEIYDATILPDDNDPVLITLSKETQSMQLRHLVSHQFGRIFGNQSLHPNDNRFCSVYSTRLAYTNGSSFCAASYDERSLGHPLSPLCEREYARDLVLYQLNRTPSHHLKVKRSFPHDVVLPWGHKNTNLLFDRPLMAFNDKYIAINDKNGKNEKQIKVYSTP